MRTWLCVATACLCWLAGIPRAQATDVETVYRSLVLVAWQVQFHYVRTGEYPEKLDEVLVPGPSGLRRIPSKDLVDPFSPLGFPYGYIISEDRRSFVVYSVGPDGLDDRGDVAYPFWPAARERWATGALGVGRPLRGDLVVSSRALADYQFPVDIPARFAGKPLLWEYMGARELLVTEELVEGLEKDLRVLDKPAVLRSGQESYLQTFKRFCGENGIQVLADLPSAAGADPPTWGDAVDKALARLHPPIAAIEGGRYELLVKLAQACGLRIFSAKARFGSLSAPGSALRVVVGDGKAEPREGQAPALVLEPYRDPTLADFEEGYDLEPFTTDPAVLERLAEVCEGVARVEQHPSPYLIVCEQWFVPMFRLLVGIDEPSRLGGKGM